MERVRAQKELRQNFLTLRKPRFLQAVKEDHAFSLFEETGFRSPFRLHRRPATICYIGLFCVLITGKLEVVKYIDFWKPGLCPDKGRSKARLFLPKAKHRSVWNNGRGASVHATHLGTQRKMSSCDWSLEKRVCFIAPSIPSTRSVAVSRRQNRNIL